MVLLPFLFYVDLRGGCIAATGAATGRADSAATCWTNCWSSVSVAKRAWVVVVTRLGARVSPTEAVSFHWDSRSNNR